MAKVHIRTQTVPPGFDQMRFFREEAAYDVVLVPKRPFAKVRFTQYTYINEQPPWTHYISKDDTYGKFFEELAELCGHEIHYHRLPDDPLAGIHDHGTVFLNDKAIVLAQLIG